MQRHELLQLMATLQLSGMRAAFDEIVADGLRRQHAFDQMLGALLQAEVAESGRDRSATRWAPPDCRWPRPWRTSASPARRSTRRWSVTFMPAASSRASATPYSSAEPVAEKRIRGHLMATEPGGPAKSSHDATFRAKRSSPGLSIPPGRRSTHKVHHRWC